MSISIINSEYSVHSFIKICSFVFEFCSNMLSVFRDGEKPKNPMVELFYGRFLAVGVLEGMHLNLLALPCFCLSSVCLSTQANDAAVAF